MRAGAPRAPDQASAGRPRRAARGVAPETPARRAPGPRLRVSGAAPRRLPSCQPASRWPRGAAPTLRSRDQSRQVPRPTTHVHALCCRTAPRARSMRQERQHASADGLSTTRLPRVHGQARGRRFAPSSKRNAARTPSSCWRPRGSGQRVRGCAARLAAVASPQSPGTASMSPTAPRSVSCCGSRAGAGASRTDADSPPRPESPGIESRGRPRTTASAFAPAVPPHSLGAPCGGSSGHRCSGGSVDWLGLPAVARGASS
mmetsp:Transcript_92701/g.262137  ORF Transcript_92701/g.262137 Transcript_92701/m.262137 type:complete len:259 (+) Transcript_92701:225-1001(+)